MENRIIKDFDKFKEINEGGNTFLGWVTGQFGEQIDRAIKETVTSRVLDYMGVPTEEEGKIGFARGVLTKVIGTLELKEMDDIVFGRRKFTDGEYWCPKLAKAIKEELSDLGIGAMQACAFLGVDPDKFLGRMITNTWRKFIMDETKIQEFLEGAWKTLTRDEFLPSKDANSVRKEVEDKLTPEQKEKLGSSGIWSSSLNVLNTAKRK